MQPEIVERIKNFYRIRYPTSKIFNESKILADLPVSLRKEAYVELYYDIVSHVPIFSICELHTQREICYRLRIVFRSAGLAITSEGQVPFAILDSQIAFICCISMLHTCVRMHMCMCTHTQNSLSLSLSLTVSLPPSFSLTHRCQMPCISYDSEWWTCTPANSS